MHPFSPSATADRTTSRTTGRPSAAPKTSSLWLRRSVFAWTGVAMLGQLVFAAYVLMFYGGSALAGAPERWNKVLPHGWKAGAALDNAVLAAHLALTVVIVLGGLVQLLPAVRRRWPALHRWTGRIYMLSAAALALGGLYLLWVRGGAAGDLSQHLAITGNALIIGVAATLAWRAARARRFDEHRRWALRLFVAVSGVWFFRVGLMAWLGLFKTPVGFNPDTFSGPFLTALAWSVYVVVPMLLLEAVLRAQRSSASTLQQAAVAVVLAGVTAVMAFGVAIATVGMWGPRMM